MGHEWFPLIATGLMALYAAGVLFKAIWDKHRFEEQEREQRWSVTRRRRKLQADRELQRRRSRT